MIECSWCGAEIIDGSFPNRRGEIFCSKYHRQASNEALKRLYGIEKDSPDRYCLTANNGDCISTDPRCMHNN